MYNKNTIMKKKLLIPALMLTPWLFMGNSPAPWQPPSEYKDYKIIDLSFSGEEYTLNIENTGEKYIVLDNIGCYENDIHLENPDVYNEQCLAPGDSGIYKGHCKQDYTGKEIPLKVYAIEVEGLATYTSVKFEKEYAIESSTEKKQSWYYYDIEDIKVDKNYRYYSVVDLTIEGERFVYYSTENIISGFSFLNKSGLTENDIKVENIYVVQGRKVDHSLDFLNVIFGLLTAAFASAGVFGVIGIIALFSFVVFMIFIGIPGIVLLIVKPWKKREKKE